jgi:hypothetical protein
VHYGTIDSPEVGVAYEYHLYVHCGIRAAKFGGRWWLAAPQRTDPFSANEVLARPELLGRGDALVAPDLARFEWDGGRADFAPAESEATPCD